MGRKSLPDPSKTCRPYWGFVEMVTTKTDDIKNVLTGDEYNTATRGHHHTPPARVLTEGVYRILRHNPEKRMHTHLVYKLGSARFAGLQSKHKALYPAHLEGQFGQLRFHPADPPDFLNYEGCKFLLISASDDIDEELGLEVKTEGAECSDLIELFGETASSRPLLSGTWV
ncbi:hypothetical protein QJS04_geneDACA014002 [Acorus gramineus]|uniref:Uncharacterized protein n=1 Tax=Acorus gramineus TaxID=55184 RepID=A0AAV9AY56_ACOGR|nr:hypothetical protein QJS04_geneDACA014002 [Acorus gramineus]